MDLASLTFLGLVGYGVVGVISYFKEDLDKRVKFLVLFLVVGAATFIPTDLGNILLEKAKMALEVAFAMTATGTLAKKIGGN